MNILLIGDSGSQDALIHKLTRSPLCDEIYYAPGDIAVCSQAQAVNIGINEAEALRDFAIEHMIGLSFVYSCLPEAAAITDCFEAVGLKVLGPTVDTVKLCTDKDFAASFLAKYVGEYTPEDEEKNDNIGLQCLCDGEHIFPLAAYKLYRTLYDNDEGEKTEGMGAYSPVELINHKALVRIAENILEPIKAGFEAENIRYKGILNLRLSCGEGRITVCGFGKPDGAPETALTLLRMKNDFVRLLLSATDGALDLDEMKNSGLFAVCCVIASGGYPGEYSTGMEINLPEHDEDVNIFYGSVKQHEGALYTCGGRVLYVCAACRTAEEAREKVYDTVTHISFSGMYYRSDIAREVL